jgi:ABC-type nitrate/sulfonate/bicarbonate transport system substrate-binding protein
LTTDLRVIVFPGGFNLPMWAAERQGFFEEQGVRVVLTPTPSSTFQMQGLAEGRFDIAMTGRAKRRFRRIPTCSPSWAATRVSCR